MPGMLILISDANVLIDLEVGGIIERAFRLRATFAVPDVLFYEELEDRHPHLVTLGLKLLTLQAEALLRVTDLLTRHRLPSRLDWMAYALAWQEHGTLLTGDRDLRAAVEAEEKRSKANRVPIHGTIWLLERMLDENVLTETEARAAVERMKANRSRQPWQRFEEMLRKRNQRNAGQP